MRAPSLILTAVVLSALAVAACEPRAEAPASEPARDPPPALPTAATAPLVAQAAAPLAANGPAATVEAESSDAIQTAANVVRVDPLRRQGPATVKLFGVGGGDPAMNGLQTHLAVFRSPADGWAVFRVGDVLDYRVLSEAPGRVDLELRESVLDDATGRIGSRPRRVIVAWPLAADGSPPARITVTPAR